MVVREVSVGLSLLEFAKTIQMLSSSQGSFLERVGQYQKRFEMTISAHRAGLEIDPENTTNKTPASKPSQVRVLLKIRPPNKKESGSFQTAFAANSAATIYYPSFQMLSEPGLDVYSRPFDGSFDQHTTLDEFYMDATKGLWDCVLQGGSFAIFAYGQTGSGKTYTVSGICDRLVHEIPFQSHNIHIQLLEVLGDAVTDLTSGSSLRVLINLKGLPVVHGQLVDIPVKDADEAFAAIQHGFQTRNSIGTLKNSNSSRSHFICKIHMKNKTSGQSSEIRIVDLAGSERNSDTKSHDAERIKQSVHINTSLMALKNCIRQSNEGNHVSYRASKLTMLLKDVLDFSKAHKRQLVMIATLAPTILDVSHSLDTFRYASALKSSDSFVAQKESKSTSPIAWTVERLNKWFLKQSDGLVEISLLMKPALDSSDFQLPPWKYIYSMEEREWIERCQPVVMDKESIISLRLLYRTLFLKKRPTAKSTDVSGSDFNVDTVLLAELPKKPSSGNGKTRQQEAMAKLAAQGKAKLAAISQSQSQRYR